MADESLGRRGSRAFGAVDLVCAAVLALGVFAGLPSRWWLVDGGALVLIGLNAAAGVGLIRRAEWARTAARVASMASLVIGLLLVTTLALTASYLGGIYGPVGRGGAIIMVLVAALAFPYLIVLPAAQLVWLDRGGSATPSSPPTPTPTPTSTA